MSRSSKASPTASATRQGSFTSWSSSSPFSALGLGLVLLGSPLGCSKNQPAPIGYSVAAAASQPATRSRSAAAPAPAPTAAAAPSPAPASSASSAAPGVAPTLASRTAEAPARVVPATPVQRTVPAGTSLSVRLSQSVSSKTANEGDSFSGELSSPVRLKGGVVLPAGSGVSGIITSAKSAGRFKGGAELGLRLTSVSVRGRQYTVQTSSISSESKGKGKRTGALIGGGGGGGALIGGLAGGGKGALIGGLLGAGAGTAGSALTGNNRDVTYSAETILNFRLSRSLAL